LKEYAKKVIMCIVEKPDKNAIIIAGGKEENGI